MAYEENEDYVIKANRREKGTENDPNVKALKELKEGLGDEIANSPEHQELKSVYSDYMKGNDAAVTDYTEARRIRSNSIPSRDPNLRLSRELELNEKFSQAEIDQAIKDYQRGDNQALTRLSSERGHVSELTREAEAYKPPFRDIDKTLEGFEKERNTTLDPERELDLNKKLATLKAEQFLGKIAEQSAELENSPTEENANALSSLEEKAPELGVTAAQVDKAKRSIGDGNGELNSKLPKEELISRLQGEIEKSQANGETTKELKAFMKEHIPASSKLHEEVQKNSTNSRTLSRDLERAMSNQVKQGLRQKTTLGYG